MAEGTSNKTPIALIIPYFGKWPSWFNIFLKTCKKNEMLHFIFFTDCNIPSEPPANTSFIPFSMSHFNELAKQKLFLNINIEEPYKICDLRPAFGKIFEDYLTCFRFWGHTDIDLIWGDVGQFITEEVLSANDIITSRKEYLTGHFTLYKNIASINNLFLESSDYRKVFTSNQSFCFDECNNLWWHLMQGCKIEELQSEIESITHVVRRAILHNEISVYWDDLVLEQDRLDCNGNVEPLAAPVIYYNGKIYGGIERMEYMYFHFHFLKKNPGFIITDWKVLPEIFCIKSGGFFEVVEVE